MLSYFEVENYGIFTERVSIRWGNGITCIFGKCGAGKTTLCMALKDIVADEKIKKYHLDDNREFKYIFIIEKREIAITYKRKQNGKIVDGAICINVLDFEYRLKKEIETPIEMIKMAVYYAEKKRKDVVECMKKFLDLFLKEEYDVECRMYGAESEWNKANYYYQKEKVNNKIGKIKIIDDAEINCIDKIKQEKRKNGIQIIVFVRRSEWINETIAPIENYYYINNGQVIRMIDGLGKEIKSTHQLKKLFLKGIYDM